MQDVGDGSVLADINEAMEVCASDQVRFALSCVQLRGSKGQVVGSDGRQLLVVRGLSFPWPDDVLVPATRVFAAKIFTEAPTVEMVRTDDRVVVRAGPWTIWLAIEKAGRYPNVDSVIPKGAATTRITLASEDAEFLLRALPRLPAGNSDMEPVTVHANGQVVVRGRSDTSPLTELILSHSQTEGRETRSAASRAYLLRVARLGLCNIRFAGDNTPVVCEDDRHIYVWQPLDGTAVLRPADDAIRIESAAAGEPISAAAKHDPRPSANLPRKDPMSNKSETIRPDEPAIEMSDEALGDPIQEAETLRSRIRELLVDVGGVVRALKRQRRQAKLVRSTLASLKSLQGVA
jgi:hypothetical protein